MHSTTATTADELSHAEGLPQLDARSLVDPARVDAEVAAIYCQVARGDAVDLHFELGRDLAERLGYPRRLLDAIPAEALTAFAGVGHHLDLAALRPGDAVLDLGSGSGTDVFCAARLVGESGRVVRVRTNDYRFTSERALGACSAYEVESISLVAEKTRSNHRPESETEGGAR